MNDSEGTFRSVSADLLRPSPLSTRLVILIMGLMLGVGLTWSCFATVLEVATGSGRVVPERRLQVVQSLEGGVVQTIIAKTGDFVSEGDVIARFNPTSAIAARNESTAQLAGLGATIIGLKAQLRILAELEHKWQMVKVGVAPPEDSAASSTDPERPSLGRLLEQLAVHDLKFPEDINSHYPQFANQSSEQLRWALSELGSSLRVLEQQMRQKSSERKEAALKLKSINEALALAKDEQAAVEKLLEAGAAGRVELNEAKSKRLELESSQQQTVQAMRRIEAGVAEIEGRLAERIGAFRAEASKQLSEAEIRRQAIFSTLAALDLRTANTEIRASATGILKTMELTSIGQVVKPGERVAEIVPSAGNQLIEVRVRPEDIAFIEKDMPAVIKLTAYDYSVFGSLKGHVERVSEDSTTDEKGTTFYLVDVRASSDHLDRKGDKWPVKIGMIANVDIVTGKRSIFQYFTKPIHRMATTAMRER